MKRLALLLSVSAAFAFSPAGSGQVVVFDTLGSPNTFDTVFGMSIQGTAPAGGSLAAFGFIVEAAPFIPSLSGPLSTVELPLGIIAGGTSINLYLAPSNGAGTLPVDYGTQFGQYTLLGSVTATGDLQAGTSAVEFLTATANPFLVAGTTYWIVAEAGSASTSLVWNLTNPNSAYTASWGPNLVPPSAYDSNGPISGVAFRVTVIPEAGTWLAASGLVALVGMHLRRRRAAVVRSS